MKKNAPHFTAQLGKQRKKAGNRGLKSKQCQNLQNSTHALNKTRDDFFNPTTPRCAKLTQVLKPLWEKCVAVRVTACYRPTLVSESRLVPHPFRMLEHHDY